MSTTYCAKQATAMAEFQSDRARAKMDDAIDAEEAREELIAARTQEIVLQRSAAMTTLDVVCGLQSITEGGGAPLIARAILAGDLATVGVYIRAAIHMYIEQDAEVEANDWIDRIDAEASDRQDH